MNQCPKCHEPLNKHNSCGACGGQQLGLNKISSISPDGYLQKCLTRVKEEGKPTSLRCPLCKNEMLAVYLPNLEQKVELDFCLNCHSIWFDFNEVKLLPQKSAGEKAYLEAVEATKAILKKSNRKQQEKNMTRARRNARIMMYLFFS